MASGVGLFELTLSKKKTETGKYYENLHIHFEQLAQKATLKLSKLHSCTKFYIVFLVAITLLSCREMPTQPTTNKSLVLSAV